MDAVILAGGLGTRISHMISKPKTLVRVNGMPIIDRQLSLLSQNGVRRVVLALGHQSRAIMDHVEGKSYGCEVLVSREEHPLGTGGAIKRALSLIRSDPFFVFNGDTLHNHLSLQLILENHELLRASITIGATSAKGKNDAGWLVVGSNKKICRFYDGYTGPGDGHTGWVNAGVYLLNQEVFSAADGDVFSFERELLPQCISRGRCYIYSIDDFYDIGTPERLTAILRGDSQWEG